MHLAIWMTLCMLWEMNAIGVGHEVHEFPPNFHFSAATAAYQVEGAWNTSGKGENIWDRFIHTHPDWILDHQNADIAADSYHHYQDDINALVSMYRFSLSWSRILPTGDLNVINHDGVEYYNALINGLLSVKIQPMVTLYHWDLPQPLQDLGGWTNPIMADYFEQYASVAFSLFGDRVKWWITFNEPSHVSSAYADGHQFAPAVESHGIGDYLATHTILQSHTRAYELYKKQFRRKQHGQIGMALFSFWYEPLTRSPTDIAAAERGLEFELGWFANPIFGSGDYPKVMRERVDINSKAEGRVRSRLPYFSRDWIKRMKGSCDFFGLNHYTSTLATTGEDGEKPSRERDSGVVVSEDASWPTTNSNWLRVVPWGMRKMLNYIRLKYNNPPVFITENGYSDEGQLNDNGRVEFYSGYISEMLKAINVDGCNVIGYTAWSLIDNFEWNQGYTKKFGLFSVDYSNKTRPRRAKKSANFFQEMISNNRVPEEIFELLRDSVPEENKEKHPLQFHVPFRLWM
ncbi:myrosinase 1 isoform X2 [Anabrus simplex]|uniref:myrosinase 1 isoform X2 n=1 Tax=Anabrus simplex TaxID=316456 RepID=UPI0035A3AB0B